MLNIKKIFKRYLNTLTNPEKFKKKTRTKKKKKQEQYTPNQSSINIIPIFPKKYFVGQFCKI